MTDSKLKQYLYLMRLHKPIGIFLLLWPTLWALWLAAGGMPKLTLLSIFILGVIVMRSAGCIINDFADRHVDAFVERTRLRPLATGKISSRAALILFFGLCLLAFGLVLFLNRLTILLAFVGAALTVVYPFMKRFTHLPQIGLGLAFAWGVPMAFAAELNSVPARAWLVFFAAALWPIIYDTMYAMVDRKDDVVIGIKSTAILFGAKTQLILASLQTVFIVTLIGIGWVFGLSKFYFISLFIVCGLCGYELWLIRHANRTLCFKAFLNNHWIGVIVFLGIIFGFYIPVC